MCALGITTHLEEGTLSSGHSFQDSFPSSYQIDSEHVIKSFILSSPKELISPASFTKVPALADPWAICSQLFTRNLCEFPHKCLSLCVGDVGTEMTMMLPKVGLAPQGLAWGFPCRSSSQSPAAGASLPFPSVWGKLFPILDHHHLWPTGAGALSGSSGSNYGRRMDFPSQSALAFHPLFP